MSFNGLTNLSLYNFRSYRFLDLPISSNFVVLYGDNGAGKTNILEAISMFSATRGLRKASLSELRFNSCNLLSKWSVDADVCLNNSITSLSTCVANDARVCKIDGSIMQSLTKFEEILWLLWITPQIDRILCEQSQIKRKFFDHLVEGIDPHHKFRIRHVSKLLKERMHILQNRHDKIWLESIENKIAELYIKINEKRRKFIELVNGIFTTCYTHLLFPHIDLEGDFEQAICGECEFNEQKDITKILLESSRADDRLRETTLYGVHRTNWYVGKNKDISADNCSSGEQKSMLILLILASLKVYESYRNGIPILLLDDLMVHLDDTKRYMFCEELKKLKTQVFLTGTDKAFFLGLQDNAQMINVKNSICFR